jgi:dihydroorotate dehydrogenase electron transfer subunit
VSVPCGERAFSRARLLDNIAVTDGVFELRFEWKGPAPDCGQFFMIRPLRGSAFLGRPISVFSWNGRAEDGEEGGTAGRSGSVGFLVAERGRGTRELRAMTVGEEAELAGPFGNRWIEIGAVEGASAGSAAGADTKPADCADADADAGADARMKPGPVALVGGGIGIAPLAFLARTLPDRSYDLYAGFRSTSYGLEGLAPRTAVVATEDGCEGCRGRIPDFLDPAPYSLVLACGPVPMLKAVAEKCAQAGIPCRVSLEARMACGVGACLGCTIRTRDGNRRCCADGPVFDGAEVVFDE